MFTTHWVQVLVSMVFHRLWVAKIPLVTGLVQARDAQSDSDRASHVPYTTLKKSKITKVAAVEL